MSKWLFIGDLHFGEKGNSEKFNGQIIDFLEWCIDLAEEKGIKRCVQFGDWFHDRHKINVETLNYGIVGAEMLGEAFGKDKMFVLEGNHDLFYLERLDISSVNALAPYVTVVVEPTEIAPGIIATPWITDGEMWDKVVKMGESNDVLLAHLELNGFTVNDKYVMEHGFSHRELARYSKVFTGHYHSIQEKDNILYLGTPYPITMNEANEQHGVFIYDDETMECEFVEYEGIRVLSIPYDKLELLEGIDPASASIRIEFPDDLDDESLLETIKQDLHLKNFEEVKIKYRGQKAKDLVETDVDVEHVEDIDAAVVNFIRASAEVESIDRGLLESLYTQAKQVSN